MESSGMTYESVTPVVTPVKEDEEYILIYKPDFKDKKDKNIINPSVAKYRIQGDDDRIQFNAFDKGKRPYRHTSKEISNDFELSDGKVKGETYQITYKGKNPEGLI